MDAPVTPALPADDASALGEPQVRAYVLFAEAFDWKIMPGVTVSRRGFPPRNAPAP